MDHSITAEAWLAARADYLSRYMPSETYAPGADADR